MMMTIGTLKKMLNAFEVMSMNRNVIIEMSKDGSVIKLSDDIGNSMVYVEGMCAVDDFCPEAYKD